MTETQKLIILKLSNKVHVILELIKSLQVSK
jgi:hypothetical protein